MNMRAGIDLNGSGLWNDAGCGGVAAAHRMNNAILFGRSNSYRRQK
ncbi:MAG: hypothetical protein H6668_07180 [Ardenticatenaceae bacterium]|nr:hypothetical protein [Ardenticatenaceae bacterium]